MSPRFDHAALAGLDEPVRRYLAHTIADGADLSDIVELSLSGTIDVGRPSRVSVGWWYGTPRFKPFYEATVLAATRRP